MYSKVEAAYLILQDYNKPLHLKEIIRIALRNKMIETKGKTPYATLGADIYKEGQRNAKKEQESRFYRIGKAIWGLTEWGEQRLSKYKNEIKKK